MAHSSYHVTEIKHDVFISFRGTDVRRGLLSHLMKQLHLWQIDAYVDVRLERGNEISSSLLWAIERSQILLVIFSKDYASSKWCLEELVKMMECEEKNDIKRNNVERNKQILIPIFYKVDPSDIRHQKGDYGVALVEHEKKEDMVKVQNWRSALKKAAQLSGFHYPLNSELTESDLVDEIVKDVSNKLSKLCSIKSDDPSESNGLIGIDQNIAWFRSLLTTESREVLMLGIWGMGGIGKTTIARVIFDTFSPEYQSCCFLENIRDDLKNQLRDLQEKLVYKLLKEENPHINGGVKAHSTKRRLSRMKVLIVLDDVDSSNLLKDFLQPICFGPGSIVIVTSRDKHVFIAGGFHRIHKVNELNFEESLKLFCINAFNESQPKIGFEELSKKAITIAKGIPLALKVFGSYLHPKSKDTWECALEKFKKYPDGEIQRVLRLSYDGLHDIEKKIFLDIAFFFKEEDKDYVIRQLDAWGCHGACGIEDLQDKALITISNDNRIQMHDLIQEIGWEIVRQESKDPGRRSRLRDAEEVYDILKNKRGTNLVEGILLDVSQIGEVAFNVDSFKQMPNLRLLKFYFPLPVEDTMLLRYYVLEDFVSVKRVPMNDLIREIGCEIIREASKDPGRWSTLWDNEDYVLETNRVIELVDGMQTLDTFTKMPNLRLTKLNWPMQCEHLTPSLKKLENVNVKGLVLGIPKQLSMNCNDCDEVLNLKTNNVSGSNQLMPIPNLSIGSALKELMSLGSEIHIKSLHYLVMDGCSVSKDFSVLTKEIKPLNFTDTGVETLNSSIGLLINLECSEILGLQPGNVGPEESSVLPNEGRQLNSIDARMELLNSSTGHFSFLECSDIDGLQLETLPSELPLLRSAYYHRLSDCREQDSGKPELIVLFDGFRYTERVSFFTLPELSFQFDSDGNLRKLWGTNDAISFQWLQFFLGLGLTRWLESLVLDGSTVERLPQSIKHLLRLKVLSLRSCKFLQSIPELPPSIQILDAFNCVLLETVAFSSITAGPHELEQVDISFQNCMSLDAKRFSCSFHQYARAVAHGYKLRRENRCFSHVSVCYPASKVPEWFTYRTWGASINIELAPNSNDIFCCLLCLVLSPFIIPLTIQVEYQFYFEGGYMLRSASEKRVLHGFWWNMSSDHVYMYYLDSHLLRKIKEGRENDQCISSSYDPKVTFQFFFEVKSYYDMPKQELDELIKECGVCPLYL